MAKLLLILSYAFFGTYGIIAAIWLPIDAVKSIKNGVIITYREQFSFIKPYVRIDIYRAKNPIKFWFFVIVWFLLSIVIFTTLIAVLIKTFV